MNAACAAALLALLTADAAQASPRHENVTAGGPLRHGVYGRIEVRHGAPPPVVREQPTLAVRTTVDRVRQDPVYLYVPPGQLRRWDQHCARWQACERPVLFVRMDDSPSRLGAWKRTQRFDPTAVLQAANDTAP